MIAKHRVLRRTTLFLLLVVAPLAACSKQILTEPELGLTNRPSPSLTPPLALSVMDDQGNERGSGYAAKLAANIRDAYGGAVEIVPTNAAPKAGQTTIKLRIIALGAFFNVGGHPMATARTTEGELGDWSGVIAIAESAAPISSGRRYVFLPGDWSGIADIHIEVTDLRPGRHAVFSMPLTAERVAPNSLGYRSAADSASDAWNAIRPRLVAFFDAAVRKLSADGSSVAPATATVNPTPSTTALKAPELADQHLKEPRAASPEPPKPSATPSAKDAIAVELAFWEYVRKSNDPALYEAYLQQYPHGNFAPLARVRFKELATAPRPATAAAPANSAALRQPTAATTAPPVTPPHQGFDGSWLAIGEFPPGGATSVLPCAGYRVELVVTGNKLDAALPANRTITHVAATISPDGSFASTVGAYGVSLKGKFNGDDVDVVLSSSVCQRTPGKGHRVS